MAPRYPRKVAGLLLLALVGCSESTDGYRTYDAGADEAAVATPAAESSQSGDTGDTQASTQAGEVAVAGDNAAATSVAVSPPTSAAPPVLSIDRPAALGSATRPPRVPVPLRIAMAGVVGDGASLTSIESSSEPREIKLLVAE